MLKPWLEQHMDHAHCKGTTFSSSRYTHLNALFVQKTMGF